MKKGKLWEGRERKRGEDDCYQLRVDPAAARAGEGRRGGGARIVTLLMRRRASTRPSCTGIRRLYSLISALARYPTKNVLQRSSPAVCLKLCLYQEPQALPTTLVNLADINSSTIHSVLSLLLHSGQVQLICSKDARS